MLNILHALKTLTMHSLAGERPSGQDVDPCSRPLSQARVYLEQIRSRVSPSAQEGQQSTRSTACKRDYLVDAAKQIRLALDREVNEDYEAAFNYYKNGVDLLLKGVQVDPNKERREAVKRKTTQYLKRAEEIFDSHLQGSLGNGTDESGGFSSLRFRPNRILSSPVEDLKMSKVIAIIDKVLLVQNPSTKEPFIVKSLPKCSLINRERQTIIPQGVPFMVQLLQYYVSDDTVFLHLEHVPGGKLWSQLHHYWPSITEKGMEFPECSSPHHKTIKLKNSYTAPSLSITCNDTSTFAPVSKEGWQREDKNKMSRECMMEYSCNTDGLRIPQSKTEQGGSDKPPCHMNGANQRNAHNEYANRTRIWQGNNKISKASLSMNGLKQSPERSSFQVAHFEYRGGITFDLAFLSEEDGDLTQSSKIMNQTMTSSVDNLMQKDLWHGKSQLLSQGKILQSLDHFSETKDSSKSLSPKSSRTCQTQAASGLLKGKASLVNDKSQHGSSPIRSPVRATSLNLKAGTRQGRKGSYQITVNPLDTIDSNNKVSSVMDSSNLVIVGSSAVLPARNTTVTVLEKGQSEQKTSVSVLNSVQQANGHLMSPLNVIESPLKLLSLKDGAPEEMLNCKDKSPAKLDHQLKLPDQFPVSETCCYHEGHNSRTVSGKLPSCRVDSARSLNRTLDSSDPCKTGEGHSLSPPPHHPNAEQSIPSQVSSGLSEDQIRIWVAEMVLALESLHQQGIICQDLNPRNILVDNAGHICLTYFGQWSEVEVQCNTKAIEDMYCAPEVGGVGEVTEACDWWSLGALLFELLTGTTLSQCYPSRIHPHTQLRLPDHLSPAAVSLLQQLLQWDYRCRLGSGENGTHEIKSHSFFSSVHWNKLNGYR
ncbi:ribosomal protein S6 kinase-like 1 isoform X2 [Pristis pectinata]|uniref:ribosomal protein S6 kinase-like 1 isoform X2 n=1 Tax=Pristis pectinata TaxID=685728 RepID=UPI00223DDCD5|nr:ribosomal protein S6 kinase-like 1 isoform X2 [Pristis pectinata]XP_051891910.1 ribosomal protein S6 kinase-like 1 isoform X2 [Pristis pectinata]